MVIWSLDPVTCAILVEAMKKKYTRPSRRMYATMRTSTNFNHLGGIRPKKFTSRRNGPRSRGCANTGRICSALNPSETFVNNVNMIDKPFCLYVLHLPPSAPGWFRVICPFLFVAQCDHLHDSNNVCFRYVALAYGTSLR